MNVPASRPLRVLVVEDSEDDALLLRRHLQRAGYHLTFERVETSAEMSRALDRQAWDIVISDYSLPQFNAPAALELLQGRDIDLPFIIISGVIGEETAVASMRAGAHDFLTKNSLVRLVPAIERELKEAADRRKRRQVERALHESEALYRLLFDSNPQPMWVYDVETTAFLAVNDAAVDHYRYSRDEFLSMTIKDIRPPEAIPSLPKAVSKAPQDIIRAGIWRHRKKDGTVIDVEVNSHGLIFAGRRAELVLAQDITERRRMEEERAQSLIREREARRAAEEANRLKDEFLATLSHELRTPLTSIIGWTLMLRYGSIKESEFSYAIEVIERSARAEARLVEDLLDISRITTDNLRLNTRPVELAPIVGAAVDSLRPATESKDIQLRTVFDPNVGKVIGDPGRLQQVMWNLLSNAIKFTPSGGRVEVGIDAVDSYARITVSDTGQGINATFLPHVFDRFRQEDGSSTRQHGGLGLGLALVRQLVELHGGTVRAESLGEGQGATFTVHLPFTADGREQRESSLARPEVESKDRDDRLARLDGLRVLIVEDDEDSRELLTTVLKRSGAEVTAASSAIEALGALEQARPHVLVSDIGIPEVDGYELMRRVRALPPERGGRVPAIALTGYARKEDQERAFTAGYQVHVAKPIEPVEFTSAVSSLLIWNRVRYE